jgi:hypothetical protein
MKQITMLFIVFISISICFAQRTFLLNQGSDSYFAKITVENCNNDNCEGKGTIELYDKKTKQIFQTLTSEDLYFFLDSAQNLTVNVIELYGEQSPLIFDDFNFDGTEDLAIRNGNNSSYSGPSYDIYVYNITKKQFVLSEELTNLAIENLGMFQMDHKRKRIITFGKSGCCWHIYTEYKVIPKKGLVKVYELEEDAQNEEYVTVTTRKLINNKWKSSVKKYKISEYYKN